MNFPASLRAAATAIRAPAGPAHLRGALLGGGAAFVAWFSARVARGITEPLFWRVNYTALGITVGVVILEWLSRSALSAALAVAWLSFLMVANALFHIAAALVDGAYMPGLVTAVLLYLPFYAWVVTCVIHARRVPWGVAGVPLLGGLPMLVHGFLIVFLGSRLF